MNGWLHPLLDDLSDAKNWSYQAGGVCAAEPTALAALALAAHRRIDAAQAACDRLTQLQFADGGVPVMADQTAPCWPTGWAVLAWSEFDSLTDDTKYHANAERAVGYILSLHGRTMESLDDMGHNPRLDGWPWVAGTHPWSEPTAINLLALKATGRSQHPRAREAAAMLIDRLLPDGGCNYGNTTVLGQLLRPHVEPTGLVLAALAGEADESGRLQRSLDWLKQIVGQTYGGASLAYALIGLTAHARRPTNADRWLASAAQSIRWNYQPLRKALIALAADSHALIALDENRRALKEPTPCSL
ncbi:MAG TPA: hypothetical protein VFI31_29690 [Pirellulales bacterium]|nr:hypothetical protein [Pirellulales bacterium]